MKNSPDSELHFESTRSMKIFRLVDRDSIFSRKFRENAFYVSETEIAFSRNFLEKVESLYTRRKIFIEHVDSKCSSESGLFFISLSFVGKMSVRRVLEQIKDALNSKKSISPPPPSQSRC